MYMYVQLAIYPRSDLGEEYEKTKKVEQQYTSIYLGI
jgi:hypothetical protein